MYLFMVVIINITFMVINMLLVLMVEVVMVIHFMLMLINLQVMQFIINFIKSFKISHYFKFSVDYFLILNHQYDYVIH